MKTWDGKHAVEQIDVTVVYFVPRDRRPLPDWQQRITYYCQRLEQFHQREFQGQSVLKMHRSQEPFSSGRTTEQLRSGDADFIFFQTLREVDENLGFGKGERTGFPILLVLSDINWRPLEDFYRLKPAEKGWEFEGNYANGRHFPGATAGGARATYLANRGVGWGLVSADGWRVPYSGSDCVVYHEGVGHTIGLPHPEPANHTVMSQGQYHGWLSQSSVDLSQKKRLGWQEPEQPFDLQADLFSQFEAWPLPLVPAPQAEVKLQLKWPTASSVTECRARIQTDLWGPWVDVGVPLNSQIVATQLTEIPLGRFDRTTPVSYRLDVKLSDDRHAELWGYFQVRERPDSPPHPPENVTKLESPLVPPPRPAAGIDLLSFIDLERDQVSGKWTRDGAALVSPKLYGSRIEIPYEPPEEYELIVIAEPLDEPNGLIIGQRSGTNRFLTLLSYGAEQEDRVNAIEDVNGQNFAKNPTTVRRQVLKKNQLSQIVCRVTRVGVEVDCDGHRVLDWQGDRTKLSLSDYWETPHKNALFLGAYDCRYRFHRVTLSPRSGEGKRLRE